MARQLRRAMANTAATPARRPLPRLLARSDLARQRRGLLEFLGEVRSELKKVVWPTRREAMNLTALVIAVSVAVGFLLGGIDYFFAQLFRFLLG